jgi:hypothetical protein
MELLFFVGWCRPFHDYFVFEPANSESTAQRDGLKREVADILTAQCVLYRNHYITSLTFNVFTDILILLIPLPLIFGYSHEFELKYAWRIKAIIGIILLLGCYGIGAAIASKMFFLTNLSSEKVFDWTIREAFTCSLCANLPRTYPLVEYTARFVSRTSHSVLSRSGGVASRSRSAPGAIPSDGTALTVREMDWKEASDSQKGIVVSTDIEMVRSEAYGGKRRESLASSSSGGGRWERLDDEGPGAGRERLAR